MACRSIHFRWLALLCFIASATPWCTLAEPTPEQIKFFETSVRPLLVENCFACHAEKKQKGGLRLDSLAAVMKGGNDGPVLIPGKPQVSTLITAVSYQDDDLQMPPDEQLSAAQVEVLTQWVRMGAPWPSGQEKIPTPLARGKKRQITDDDRAFWSFQPVRDPPVPATQDGGWVRNPVDSFIFAKLTSEKIAPAPPADRAALIRRATFDLHGLPPTPEEVDAFVNDPSSTAYETLIDRLLASPHYGERWARHWLDLVRYAESDGYKQDAFRTNSWPYRDWVIQSLNADKPYDRFVTEQLAGDEIAPNDPNVLVATGYFRHGTYEYNQRNVHTQWDAMLADITDVTGDVFLGMSMACARCHDHKFDPILQRDYYKLQAFFAPIQPRQDLPLATPAQKAEYAERLKAWKSKTQDIREKMRAIEEPLEKAIAEKTIDMFPLEVQAIIRKPERDRTPLEQQHAEMALRQVREKVEPQNVNPSKEDARKLAALKKELAAFDDLKPKPLMMGLVATDVGDEAPPTVIPADPRRETIAPGYPTVLEKLQLKVPEISPSQNSTGRRTALAKWITQPENPLAARVMVNRLWQHHFGRGLVGTSSDFGKLGDRPSHPELLDWMARRFVADGWSLKKMHRLMMTSATYQQSALRAPPDVAMMKDPENRWLWRFNTRRLEAEEIRDAMLAVSGELSAEAGGPSKSAESPRRSIYVKVLRNQRDLMLDLFDAAEPFGSVANRNSTTTANQALLMINGEGPLKRAAAFAHRLEQVGPADSGSMVDSAYRLAYGRLPRPEERTAAARFLDGGAELIDFCHALMNSNEFLFVD